MAIRERDTGTGAVLTRYQHTDALGSPVVVTNESRTVVKRNEYEPYGKLVGAAMEDGPGYTGHMADAATGLVYMQQRYYDPTIDGRFPSVDPVTQISPGGTFNRYWYANANPYRFRDPDGRQANRPRECGQSTCPEEGDSEEPPEPPEPPKGCGKTRDCFYAQGKWHLYRFDWGSALGHWRKGKGEPVYVYARQLGLNGAKFVPVGKDIYLVHTKTGTGTWVVFGTITADVQNGTTLTFREDYYDFDIKNAYLADSFGEARRLIIRNSFTTVLALHIP